MPWVQLKLASVSAFWTNGLPLSLPFLHSSPLLTGHDGYSKRVELLRRRLSLSLSLPLAASPRCIYPTGCTHQDLVPLSPYPSCRRFGGSRVIVIVFLQAQTLSLACAFPTCGHPMFFRRLHSVSEGLHAGFAVLSSCFLSSYLLLHSKFLSSSFMGGRGSNDLHRPFFQFTPVQDPLSWDRASSSLR